jgi:hypothetical protein
LATVPRRHYALNLSYGFIYIFVVSAFMPVVAAGVAAAYRRAGWNFRLGLSAILAASPLPWQQCLLADAPAASLR